MGIRMGKPGRGEARSSWGEYIAHTRRTRGTETSKYPEEKETRVIPPVAASERGRAQTDGAEKAAAVVPSGLREVAGGSCRIFGAGTYRAEARWKASPEEVKAL
jgi:hypothetical protein